MNLKTLFLLLLSCICAGCKSSIEERIGQMGEGCEAQKCEIDLNDFTDFKWDKVYVCNYPPPREYMDKILGMKYTDFVEGARPIVFIYKKQIVHSENYKSWEFGSDAIVDKQLIFDEDGPNNYSSDDAHFILRKNHYSSSKCFYYLKHIPSQK